MVMELLGAVPVEVKSSTAQGAGKSGAEPGQEAPNDDEAVAAKRRESVLKRAKSTRAGLEGEVVLGQDEAIDRIFEKEGWNPVTRTFSKHPDWHAVLSQVCACHVSSVTCHVSRGLLGKHMWHV
jgi:hypothetical protein